MWAAALARATVEELVELWELALVAGLAGGSEKAKDRAWGSMWAAASARATAEEMVELWGLALVAGWGLAMVEAWERNLAGDLEWEKDRTWGPAWAAMSALVTAEKLVAE